MNFLEAIFERLAATPERLVLQEAHAEGGRLAAATSGELLDQVGAARAFLVRAGVKKGDRCALLAHNSIRWAALDLALMAEGVIVVPLYARQAPAELVGMMKDCSPSLICCGDQALADAVRAGWRDAPPICRFDEIFAAPGSPERNAAAPAAGSPGRPVSLRDKDAVTIIYTSGTSGEPKGVVLNAGNLNHMLKCTTARLDLLMAPPTGPDAPPAATTPAGPDEVFHYLPFCFAGSWILLLTCLSRDSVLALSTDLARLADEMKMVTPHYFLNVPALLERIRTGVEEQIAKRGGVARMLFSRGRTAWFRRQTRAGFGLGALWVKLAERVVFSAIRKKLGPDLRALICGSAPLAKETQLFFKMLGIPVLQVYGLTETTGICTMDHPQHVEPGRVGPAVNDVEMKLGEDDEVLVRGPNVFPGYWNRPQDTARSIRDGWFHTGDQGERDSSGNWRIIGRLKNLIILNSGHNIAPEPIEEMMLRAMPGAQQVVLAGNGRGFLSAVVTGDVTAGQVEATLAKLNPRLPHYKRLHAFHLRREPFTIENGLLTANGKLKRDAIAALLQPQIEEIYRTSNPAGVAQISNPTGVA